MKVNFIINNCLNHTNVNREGCGASELLFYNTLLSLSKFYKIDVYNHSNRLRLDDIEYRDYDSFNENQGDTTIVQRYFDKLINLHKQFPNNKYILWSHDFLENGYITVQGEYSLEYINSYFKNNGITTVAVSNFHKNNIKSKFPDIEIVVIYNALFPGIFPKIQNVVKKNEITFASNWAKGLENVLNIMKEYYKRDPTIKLNLLKPSYCEMQPDFKDYPFINVIGTIRDKTEYSRLISQSICVLTTSYAETFGCIFAESLHLGTPVVADRNVSAGFHEFVEERYRVNFKNCHEVIESIESIKNNNPVVDLHPQFYETEIIEQWKTLINFK
jgi:glycosyltransferase involved in cell wall biosynthesis